MPLEASKPDVSLNIDDATSNKQDTTTNSGSLHEIVDIEEGPANETFECAICMEQYKVGDWVAMSALGHCQRHVFHYDCLLEWAALQKEDCPVCKQTFWSADTQQARACNNGENTNSIEVLSRSQFCETHGLTTFDSSNRQ